MSGTIGLIKEALKGEVPGAIETLSNTLDKKVGIRNFWKSDVGKSLTKKLQDDSVICLNALQNFESLSIDEIRGLLAKYRANTLTLSTIKESSNVDEIQEMLDNAVKEEAELRRGR